MSWFHVNVKAPDVRNHASAAEVVACFQQERRLLRRLAFLITEDEVTADQSVINACNITLRGNSPFYDWLREWAKAATITSAISRRAGAIRAYEASYRDQRCTHVEHLSQADAEERESDLNLIVHTEPSIIIADLDPLSRAILVLRVATRSSIQDCVLRLNVSRAAVLAASCRTMTWLHDFRLNPLEQQPDASPCIIEEHPDSGPLPNGVKSSVQRAGGAPEGEIHKEITTFPLQKEDRNEISATEHPHLRLRSGTTSLISSECWKTRASTPPRPGTQQISHR